jgi:hypothetical protein
MQLAGHLHVIQSVQSQEVRMKYSDYKKWSERANVWIDTYFRTLKDRPVRAQTRPGDIAKQIAVTPPERAEDMEAILSDFERIIPDGMTHWQHPRFFAYFPANAAPASMIAEQLANAMAAQCMLWQTSPSGTELETVMVGWLRDALGLPQEFQGVIQDSASSATLSAVLTMRERSQAFQGNRTGYAGAVPARIYCSEHVHSSVDKAAWIAGIGQENLVKIPTLHRRIGPPAPTGKDCPRRGPVYPPRRRLGRQRHDLPRVPRYLGRRAGVRQCGIQPAQMAGGAVRLLRPVPARPDRADHDARDQADLSAHARA